MNPADGEETTFQLGDWRIERSRNEIHREGEVRHLRRLTMEVLVQLADEAPAVVSTERLIDAHWPHDGIGDHGLKTVISELRRAFGDDARNPSYIQTIPKRGYRLIAPVSWDADSGQDSANAPGTEPTDRWRFIGMGVLLAALALGFTVLLLRRESDAPMADADTVRVLLEPLATGDPGDDLARLQIGLHEELANALSGISRIHLLLGGSAAHQRGADDYVLSGSIRRRGVAGVRIVASLSRSGRALWSSPFDERLDEPVDVQIDVATKVARAMNRVVNAQGWLNTESGQEASLALLRAVLALDDTYDGLKTAIAYADQALQIDAGFARAMAFKAATYRGAANWFLMDVEDAVAQMHPLIRDALAADPHLGLAWAVDAQLKLYQGDFNGAEISIRNAEQHASIHDLLMISEYYTWCGRFDEALALLARRIQADPTDPRPRRFMGQTLHYAGHYQQAIDVFDDVLEVMPRDARARHLKGHVLESLGKYPQAAALQPWFGLVEKGWAAGGTRGIAEAFLQFARDTEQGRTQFPPGSAWRIYTWAYARLGEPEEAVRWMARGWEAGDRWEFFYLRVYDWPGFDLLRAHPAFQQLMDRTIGNPPTCPGSRLEAPATALSRPADPPS